MGFEVSRILDDEYSSINSRSQNQFNIEEDIEIVLLDNNVNRHIDLIDVQDIPNTINKYEDFNEFADYLERNVYVTLFVIVNVDELESSLSFIQDLSHVNEIYIYSSENFTQNCRKIRGVYKEISRLVQDLKVSINRFHWQSIVFDCIQDINQNDQLNLNQSGALFLMQHFLVNCLKILKFDERAKDELISAFRLKYSNNKTRLKEINNFERNYRSELALEWYTEESLFFQTINNSLRTHNFDSIFALRFLIQDLCQLINRNIDRTIITTTTVYRGQRILKSEFERLIQTKNGFIQINNFISTFTNRELAVNMFDELPIDPDKIQVLFIFDIKSAKSNFCKRFEHEILFSMGNIFHIQEIIVPNEMITFFQVRLSFIEENDHLFDRFTNWIERETYLSQDRWQQLFLNIINQNPFHFLKDIYTNLEEISFDDIGKALKLNKIGRICHKLADYQTAIFLQTEALKLQEKYLASDTFDFIYTFNGIALTYYDNRNYLEAIQFYEKSYKIQQKYPQNSCIMMIETCNMIASAYAEIQDYSNRLIWLEKALNLKRISGYIDDISTAKIYTDLGDVCYSIQDYIKAIPYYKKALQIQQKSPANNQRAILINIKSIGMAHGALKNYSDALIYFEKALKIQKEYFADDKRSIADLYFHIADMYQSTGNFQMALSYYNMKLNLEQEILPENDSSFISIHLSIAFLLIKLEQIQEASKHLSQAVVIGLNKCETNSFEMKNLKACLSIIKKKEWTYPALFVSNSTAESILYAELNYLTDEHFRNPTDIDDCEKQLKSNNDIKTIILDALSISIEERNRQLTIISSFSHIESIYILGKAPNPGDDWLIFLKQFPKTRMFFDNENQLAVRWVLDITLDYRRMAMNYKKDGNNDAAQQYIQRCLDLYARLQKPIKPEK